MQWPSKIWTILMEEAQRHGDDIPAAIGAAEERGTQLPEFPDMLKGFIRGMFQEGIYAARVAINQSIKHPPAKPHGSAGGASPGGNGLVNQIWACTYDYCIGRKTLGSMNATDLLEMAASERSIAKGHLFNARLGEELAPLLPAGKTVRQAISKRKLDAIWKKIEKELSEQGRAA